MPSPLPLPASARNPFEMTGSRDAYVSPWIRVEHHDVIRPDGKPGTYSIVRMAYRATGVLPLWDDGTVTLVGQWRVPLGRWSWEMPEGGVEPGEDMLEAARRELLEETGLAARHWVKAVDLDLSNSSTDDGGTTFVAWGIETAGPLAPDPTEVIEVIRVPFADLVHAIETGVVRDALTIATVFQAERFARAGVLPEPLARAILA